MNVCIGLITGLLLVLLFRQVEKKRVATLGIPAFVFCLYVVLCSFLLNPSESFGIWLGFCLILYAVLDDMKTKTLHIYYPLITTIWFFFFLEKPYIILYSFFFFFILLLFTKITKERFFGEGDIYLWLPLSILILFNSNVDYAGFFIERWVIAFLFSLFAVAVLSIPLKLMHSSTETFAFGPFLTGGYVLVYADPSWAPSLLVWLFIATCFLYMLWFLVFLCRKIYKWIRKKRRSD